MWIEITVCFKWQKGFCPTKLWLLHPDMIRHLNYKRFNFIIISYKHQLVDSAYKIKNLPKVLRLLITLSFVNIIRSLYQLLCYSHMKFLMNWINSGKDNLEQTSNSTFLGIIFNDKPFFILKTHMQLKVNDIFSIILSTFKRVRYFAISHLRAMW